MGVISVKSAEADTVLLREAMPEANTVLSRECNLEANSGRDEHHQPKETPDNLPTPTLEENTGRVYASAFEKRPKAVEKPLFRLARSLPLQN